MMTARAMLDRLLEGNNLSQAEAGDLLLILTDQQTLPAMAGALLIALRAKGSLILTPRRNACHVQYSRSILRFRHPVRGSRANARIRRKGRFAGA